LIESLLRFGHLNRAQALEALAELYACPGIDMADLAVDATAKSLLSGQVAWQLKALPFRLESDGGVVAIACLDPHEPNLLPSLTSVFGDRRIRLYVALKCQLEPALLTSYRESMASIPSEPDSTPITPTAVSEPQSRLLIVGPPSRSNQYLAQSLAEVYDRVVFVNTATEALLEVEEQTYCALLINSSEPGELLGLMRRFRAGSPSGQIRFYKDVRTLITGGETMHSDDSALHGSWAALVKAALHPPDDGSNPRFRLASLADQLSHRLGLPEDQRARAVLAAHLYSRQLIRGNEASGASPSGLGFCPVDLSRNFDLDNIVKLIEHDSIRLGADHLSFDRLAADIIAQIAFCLSRWERLDNLNFEQFETVKAHLTALAGRRFLPEVVSAWIEILRDGIALTNGLRKNSRVVLLDDRGEDTLMLQPCLENLEFQVTYARSVDQVVPAFERKRPDMMLILKHGAAAEVRNLIEDLTARGIPIDQLPTFVLAERFALAELTDLLKAGVEEIMPLDGDLDPLLVKMCRTRIRLEQESSRQLSLIQHVGTHGTLEDMNVVDLLQAMGMSDKTLRLSITAHGSHLSMFLDHGHLIFAECDDREGADAVFAGLTWTRGVWSVDPVSREDLPEPNNDRSIDSILIEGCCLLDERQRDEAASSEPQADSLLVEADN